MQTLNFIIERASDGTYSAFCEDDNFPAYGMGDSVEAAKNEALEGLRLFLDNNPKSLTWDSLEFSFNMDVSSLLHYYKGVFSFAAFERISGINQRQLQHYSSGLKNPSPSTRKKIESALHKLGKELLTIEI